MSEQLLPKIEKRALRYDFTASEVHDLSLQLAAKTKEHQAVEEEKKSVVSQYSAKLKEIRATTNKLSNLVADGWELREVDCEVEYHKPQQGKKTLIRKDTNKVTSIEAMTDYEWNLFNQPPDEEKAGKGPKKKKKGAKKKNDDQEDLGLEPIMSEDHPAKTTKRKRKASGEDAPIDEVKNGLTVIAESTTDANEQPDDQPDDLDFDFDED